MDYQKTYSITQLPGQKIILRWTTGYREIELEYENEIIFTSSGIAKLRKGISFLHDKLGVIQLKFSEKPIMVDVIVDGFHSPGNVSHPAKQLRFASNYFWIIAVFALIGSLMEGIVINTAFTIATIVSLVNLASVALYIIAAVNTNRSKPWGFFLGFYTFCFWTLITLLLLPFAGAIGIIAFVMRCVFFYFLITNFKHARGVAKHRKFGRSFGVASEQLLDN